MVLAWVQALLSTQEAQLTPPKSLIVTVTESLQLLSFLIPFMAPGDEYLSPVLQEPLPLDYEALMMSPSLTPSYICSFLLHSKDIIGCVGGRGNTNIP
jgi:hypothetical protein